MPSSRRSTRARRDRDRTASSHARLVRTLLRRDRIPNNSITIMRNRFYRARAARRERDRLQDRRHACRDRAGRVVRPHRLRGERRSATNCRSIFDKYGVEQGASGRAQLSVQYLAMKRRGRCCKDDVGLRPGRELRDLTRRAALAGRLLRGRAHRPDPAAGDARLQARRRVPARADQAVDRAGEAARPGPHARRHGDPVDVDDQPGAASGPDLPAEPEGDRARRAGAGVHARGADPEGGDQGRRLRLHDGGLGRRLCRSVRFRRTCC